MTRSNTVLSFAPFPQYFPGKKPDKKVAQIGTVPL